MGKRNRNKIKKSNRTQISKLTFTTKLISINFELLVSKEAFIDELKTIYSRNLKKFQENNQVRVENNSFPQLRYSQILRISSSCHECSITDPSNEYFHIFYIQVNKFLNSIIQILRESAASNNNLIKLLLKEANHILEVVCKEVDELVAGIQNGKQMNCEKISVTLFRDKLLNDTTLNKYIIDVAENFEEETNHSDDLNKPVLNRDDINTRKSSPSKRTKKKKKKPEEILDVDLDQEIEEFKNKLEVNMQITQKGKPNFSEEWIAKLRKQLKNS